MRLNPTLLLTIYWVICCGFYYFMASAFVVIMVSLRRVPKGWLRNSLWVFFFWPARIIVVFFPYFSALYLFYFQRTREVTLFILTQLLFLASLIPAWRYVRKHRRFIHEVIKR
jgi:hypothetical protein